MLPGARYLAKWRYHDFILVNVVAFVWKLGIPEISDALVLQQMLNRCHEMHGSLFDAIVTMLGFRDIRDSFEKSSFFSPTLPPHCISSFSETQQVMAQVYFYVWKKFFVTTLFVFLLNSRYYCLHIVVRIFPTYLVRLFIPVQVEEHHADEPSRLWGFMAFVSLWLLNNSPSIAGWTTQVNNVFTVEMARNLTDDGYIWSQYTQILEQNNSVTTNMISEHWAQLSFNYWIILLFVSAFFCNLVTWILVSVVLKILVDMVGMWTMLVLFGSFLLLTGSSAEYFQRLFWRYEMILVVLYLASNLEFDARYADGNFRIGLVYYSVMLSTWLYLTNERLL
eukprot:m.43666 g.43666  ORF g.43666 m.43666 type:complete len:336 (+) comp8458_c0_seq1:293-1300(+)